jgi:hypothetical protein
MLAVLSSEDEFSQQEDIKRLLTVGQDADQCLLLLAKLDELLELK